MIALGYSLWKVARTDDTTQPAAIDATAVPSNAGV